MKIKTLIISIAILISYSVIAQRTIIATDTLRVTGKIKTDKIFTLTDLDAFPKLVIKDQIIYNHKGEIKDTLRKMKGVLLKTILEPIEFIYEKPKFLNEFYFVFIASDGYKVVFHGMKFTIPKQETVFL